MTNSELVRKIRENNWAYLLLLACPMPTSDGALLGYEGELHALDIDGDELLEAADLRGLDRQAALLGIVKRGNLHEKV